jgi:hypothetical protein
MNRLQKIWTHNSRTNTRRKDDRQLSSQPLALQTLEYPQWDVEQYRVCCDVGWRNRYQHEHWREEVSAIRTISITREGGKKSRRWEGTKKQEKQEIHKQNRRTESKKRITHYPTASPPRPSPAHTADSLYPSTPTRAWQYLHKSTTTAQGGITLLCRSRMMSRGDSDDGRGKGRRGGERKGLIGGRPWIDRVRGLEPVS